MSTTDVLIGERIHQIMWRQRMTQGQLAARLGLTQTGVSRKIRGERPWFARELLEVAKALNTQVSALLPPLGDFDPPVTQLPQLESSQQPFDNGEAGMDGRRIPTPPNLRTPQYTDCYPPKNLTLRNQLDATSLEEIEAA